MNVSRREWIRAACLATASFAVSRRAFGASWGEIAPITVYKTPTCGCCKEWVKHINASGFFKATVHDLDDLSSIKRSLGVPRALESCHTAVVGRLVIEGHVPADLIRKLGADPRPPKGIAGLAVPGMVSGSPGMEGGPKEPYDVIAFYTDGKTSIYARR